MADLQAPIQGELNIGNVQGSSLEIILEFFDELDVPIDLTLYQAIKMDIKEIYSVRDCAFLTFDLTDGLTISGADNNVLSFSLDEEFWRTQTKTFVYDIVFTNASNESFTFIKGNINNVLTATKPTV